MHPPNNWAVSEVILIYKFAMKLRKKTSSSGLLPMCAYCIYVHLLCQHVCFGEKRAGSSLQSGHTNDFMLCLFMQCVTPFGEKKPVALLNLGILCDIWEDAWTMIDIFLKSFVSDIGSWEDRNITFAGTCILTVKLYPFILAYSVFFPGGMNCTFSRTALQYGGSHMIWNLLETCWNEPRNKRKLWGN